MLISINLSYLVVQWVPVKYPHDEQPICPVWSLSKKKELSPQSEQRRTSTSLYSTVTLVSAEWEVFSRVNGITLLPPWMGELFFFSMCIASLFHRCNNYGKQLTKSVTCIHQALPEGVLLLLLQLVLQGDIAAWQELFRKHGSFHTWKCILCIEQCPDARAICSFLLFVLPIMYKDVFDEQLDMVLRRCVANGRCWAFG